MCQWPEQACGLQTPPAAAGPPGAPAGTGPHWPDPAADRRSHFEGKGSERTACTRRSGSRGPVRAWRAHHTPGPVPYHPQPTLPGQERPACPHSQRGDFILGFHGSLSPKGGALTLQVPLQGRSPRAGKSIHLSSRPRSNAPPRSERASLPPLHFPFPGCHRSDGDYSLPCVSAAAQHPAGWAHQEPSNSSCWAGPVLWHTTTLPSWHLPCSLTASGAPLSPAPHKAGQPASVSLPAL